MGKGKRLNMTGCARDLRTKFAFKSRSVSDVSQTEETCDKAIYKGTTNLEKIY